MDADGQRRCRGQQARSPCAPRSPAACCLTGSQRYVKRGHDRARIRREEADPPHLLVTHQEDEFIRQWRVAAHVGEPTREDPEPRSRAAVHTRGAASPAPNWSTTARSRRACCGTKAARRGIRLRSFTEFQGLLDLRDYVAGQAARLAADPRYPPASMSRNGSVTWSGAAPAPR